MSQIQALKIKLCSEYEVTDDGLVDAMSYIAGIQSKHVEKITLDFSEMNLIGFGESLHKALVRILTSLKSLREFELKFAKVTKSISSIWNRTFKELIGTQLPIKTLKIALKFDDERNLIDEVYFSFLESLSSQNNLENFYLNIRLDSQARRRGFDKEKAVKKAINLVLQKLNCLNFLKRLKVTFEKGFTHVKFQDVLKLKSLQDLTCIPRLWIAWENNIITESSIVHNI